MRTISKISVQPTFFITTLKVIIILMQQNEVSRFFHISFVTSINRNFTNRSQIRPRSYEGWKFFSKKMELAYVRAAKWWLYPIDSISHPHSFSTRRLTRSPNQGREGTGWGREAPMTYDRHYGTDNYMLFRSRSLLYVAREEREVP